MGAMRRRVGFTHRLAVLAALIGLLAPVAMSGHPLFETDRDCGPVVFGAHRTTEFETDLPSTTPEHCAFCHFLRAISSAAPSTVSTVAPALSEVVIGPAANDRLHRSAHLGLQPTRAPPAIG